MQAYCHSKYAQKLVELERATMHPIHGLFTIDGNWSIDQVGIDDSLPEEGVFIEPLKL